METQILILTEAQKEQKRQNTETELVIEELMFFEGKKEKWHGKRRIWRKWFMRAEQNGEQNSHH